MGCALSPSDRRPFPCPARPVSRRVHWRRRVLRHFGLPDHVDHRARTRRRHVLPAVVLRAPHPAHLPRLAGRDRGLSRRRPVAHDTAPRQQSRRIGRTDCGIDRTRRRHLHQDRAARAHVADRPDAITGLCRRVGLGRHRRCCCRHRGGDHGLPMRLSPEVAAIKLDYDFAKFSTRQATILGVLAQSELLPRFDVTYPDRIICHWENAASS